MAGFMSKVSFAPKVAVLMKATSDDLNPTPGYLYDEIAKITYESLEYCEYMTEFLNDRLNKKSLQVKGKVLLVMKNVLQKGHEEFARCLRRKDSAIQSCKVLNGPPDPLHGDTFYANIRNTAAVVLDTLFDLDNNKVNSEVSYPTTASYSSGSRMEGFGNTTDSSTEGGLMKEMYGNLKGAFQNLVSSPSSKTSLPVDNQYSPYDPQSNRYPTTINQPSDTITNFFNSSSNKSTSAVPGTTNTFSSYSENLLCPTSPSKHNWIARTSGNTSNDIKTGAGIKVSQKAIDQDMYETEKRLVDEITILQGIRPQPSKRDVDALIKRCANLNCSVVVEQLYTKLTGNDARVQLRVMCVVEGMLESGLPDIKTLIESKCLIRIKELTSSAHSPTRNKAVKILSILKVDITPTNTSGDMVASHLSDNLFGDLDVQAAPVPFQQTTSSVTNSLIFDSNSSPSAANTPQSLSLLDPLTPAQPNNLKIIDNASSLSSSMNFDPFEQHSSSTATRTNILTNTNVEKHSSSTFTPNDPFTPAIAQPENTKTQLPSETVGINDDDFFAGLVQKPNSSNDNKIDDLFNLFASFSPALKTSETFSTQQNEQPVNTDTSGQTNNRTISSVVQPSARLNDMMLNFNLEPQQQQQPQQPQQPQQQRQPMRNIMNHATDQPRQPLYNMMMTNMDTFNNQSQQHQQNFTSQNMNSSSQNSLVNPSAQRMMYTNYQMNAYLPRQTTPAYNMQQPPMYTGNTIMNQPRLSTNPNSLDFLRGNSSQNNKGKVHDSFNFVQDAMRASKK